MLINKLICFLLIKSLFQGLLKGIIMIGHLVKRLFILILFLFLLPVCAEKSISVTVKTTDKTAVAIGYMVGGKPAGCVGKSYSGKGPQNKEYMFGYRKSSIRGANISCGKVTLRHDSTVILVNNGDKCQTIITH